MDGQVDEVLATINVSRGGLYFTSQQDAYHRGMRVLVTLAFSDLGTDSGLEEPREIVRVDRLKDNRVGVAVRLLKTADSAPHKVCRLDLQKRKEVQ